MAHHKTWRHWACVLAIATVSVFLAGCSAVLPGFDGPSATAKPVVGDCWTATFNESQTWADWAGQPPVGCATAHQTYTYAVVNLTASLPYSWLDAKTDDVAVAVRVADAEVCSAKLKALVPQTPGAGRLAPSVYNGTVAQWEAGQHWVRCDLSVVAVGSALLAPRLANLPSKFQTLIRTLKTAPETYAYCVDSTDSTGASGPFDAGGSTFADCTDSPQWRISSSPRFPGALSSPYPTPASRHAFDMAHCVDTSALHWWAIYPSQAGWAAGLRTVQCWAMDGPTT